MKSSLLVPGKVYRLPLGLTWQLSFRRDGVAGYCLFVIHGESLISHKQILRLLPSGRSYAYRFMSGNMSSGLNAGASNDKHNANGSGSINPISKRYSVHFPIILWRDIDSQFFESPQITPLFSSRSPVAHLAWGPPRESFRIMLPEIPKL